VLKSRNRRKFDQGKACSGKGLTTNRDSVHTDSLSLDLSVIIHLLATSDYGNIRVSSSRVSGATFLRRPGPTFFFLMYSDSYFQICRVTKIIGSKGCFCRSQYIGEKHLFHQLMDSTESLTRPYRNLLATA
jgi:hypothetical protein